MNDYAFDMSGHFGDKITQLGNFFRSFWKILDIKAFPLNGRELQANKWEETQEFFYFL